MSKKIGIPIIELQKADFVNRDSRKIQRNFLHPSHQQKTLMIKTALLLTFFLVIGAAAAGQCFPLGTPPQPSGPYSLGTTIFYLTDQTRKDPTDSVSGRGREIMIQLWYPASTPQGPGSPYIPDPGLISAMKNDDYLNINPLTIENWSRLKTHATLDASIVLSPVRFPLILFSHGFGITRSNYTFILEELASHGFILAAIDHPASGLTILPDGRILSLVPDPLGPDGKVQAMTQDALFILNALLDVTGVAGRFTRHIDSERIGMFGHSLGGAAALDMGRIDGRFRACANMDGYPFGRLAAEGLHQASLVLLQQPGEPIHISDQMRFERDSLWSAISQRQNSETYTLTIKGTSHFNFSDLPFIVPDSLMTRNGGTIVPQRGHEIITRVLCGFFAHYLQGNMSKFPQAFAAEYPEVTVKRMN
jgi:pimeloyl-ACP methyl ester carboxylesterase